jgi:hypothetical protein
MGVEAEDAMRRARFALDELDSDCARGRIRKWLNSEARHLRLRPLNAPRARNEYRELHGRFQGLGENDET